MHQALDSLLTIYTILCQLTQSLTMETSSIQYNLIHIRTDLGWYSLTCTVAFGSHAIAINAFSFKENPFPRITIRATTIRMTRPTSISSIPWPALNWNTKTSIHKQVNNLLMCYELHHLYQHCPHGSTGYAGMGWRNGCLIHIHKHAS